MEVSKQKLTATLMLFTVLFLSSTRLIAQPVPQWVKTYNGTNNGNDRIKKTVIDASGNIYALGTTYNAQTKDDVILIKYNSQGTEQWTKIYSGDTETDDKPADIVIDASGNIHIAINNISGSSFERFVIRKYSPSGSVLYTYVNNNSAASERTASCLHVQKDGTLFAGGRIKLELAPTVYFGQMIYKFNTAGTVLDSFMTTMDTLSATNIADMVSDNSGNLYYTGTRNNNLSTFKLNFALDSVWGKQYNGAGNGIDEGIKIMMANDLTICVGGTVLSAAAGKDYAILKYENNGTQAWAKTYNGPASGQDELYDIVMHSNGDMFATGRVAGGSSGYDIGTLRITATGSITWTNLFNGSGNGNDWGQCIALDNAGAVYVAGTSNEGANGTDFIVLKYSTLFANQHWAAKYSLSTSDTLASMVLDANYNIIVSGHQKRFLNNDRDMGVYKLASTIGIQETSGIIPEKFELGQNYPNPFNPVTNIRIQLPSSGFVKLVVFDITGKEAAVLVNENLSAGAYNIDFDASNLASGVYFYRFEITGFTDVKKMMLVK